MTSNLKHFGLIIGLLLFTTSAFARQGMLDSLKLVLEKLEPSGQKATVLYQIGKEIVESDPDSAFYYVEASKSIIDSLDLDSLRGALYIIYSTAHSYKAEYDLSSQYAFEALKNGTQYDNDLVKYDAYTNLGIDFLYQEDYNKSYGYFNKAREVADQLDSPYRLAHALNNLGMIAYYLGDSGKEKVLYEQALATFEKISDKEGIGNTLLNIGTWFTVDENFTRANELYQQALDIFEEIEYKSAQGHTLESMAENYALAGNYDKALTMAERALKLFIENENKQDQAYCYELLGGIYQKQGNYRKAYFYQNKYHELFEIIYNEEKAALVEDLHLKYETAKKQAVIAKLRLANELKEKEISEAHMQFLMIVGTLIFIVVMATSLIVLLKRKQKAEREAQDLQLDALKKRFMELHASSSDLAVTLDFEELNSKLHNPLTEREFEALKLSLEGKTNPEIADKIFVSVSTVKFHLRNTYSKLGVTNRKEAFQYILKTS